MRKEILRLENICKTIDGIKVLKNVSLNLYEGETVKLYGDEGRSLSSIVGLFGGVIKPDSGRIYIDGKEIKLASPLDGKKAEISIIHKKSDLIPNLTVMENLFLERKNYARGLFLKEKKQRARAVELLEILGLDISPDMMASDLKLEQMQIVQLGKALLDDRKIIIMDHTHILLDKEQIKLFEGVFNELAKRNVGILILAQNLRDFTSVSDRMYIMKEGSIIGNLMTSEMEKDKIIQMIAKDYYSEKSGIYLNQTSEEVLRVEGLSTKNMLRNVSFSLNKGEIVSITGSYGSGKYEVGYALYGMERTLGGKIYLHNKRIKIKNPSDAIKRKIVLLSFEKKENGLLYNLSAKENITISRLGNISNFAIIRKELENWLIKTVYNDLSLNIEDDNIAIEGLSLVNQRKVSLARAISCNPDVLILIDPTKGLENESKKQILELLVSFSDRGIAILLISSNLHEILQVSHRVWLFSNGTITGCIDRDMIESREQMNILSSFI